MNAKELSFYMIISNNIQPKKWSFLPAMQIKMGFIEK
jgi:hypothetical protein